MARRFEREKDEEHTGGETGEGLELEEGLSEEELALQHAQVIPDRAALSTVNADVAIPVNPALAADVLLSVAGEDAEALENPYEEQQRD